MKLKINVLLMGIFLLISVEILQAQPYKGGVGIVLGSMEGVQGKLFLTPHLALQGDLACKLGVYPFTILGIHFSEGLYDFEFNPNLLYQKNIVEWNFGQLDWFAGGGFSLGYAFRTSALGISAVGSSGKFGLNTIGGAELSLAKIPLAFTMDFRPGYGLLFERNATTSYFDWTLSISVRYCFRGNKGK